MQIEKLKRLKVSVMVLIMCISFYGCAKKSSETIETYEDQLSQEKSNNFTSIFFVEGKAVICPEEYSIYMDEHSSRLSKNDKLLSLPDMYLSNGIEVIKIKNLEDAIDFAEAIVGEENIIYLNIEKDNITFEKTLK